jgi:hypothetical protein
MDNKQLRRRVIRLAYEKPELRGDLLPLVTAAWRRPGAVWSEKEYRHHPAKFEYNRRKGDLAVAEMWLERSLITTYYEDHLKRSSEWKAFQKQRKALWDLMSNFEMTGVLRAREFEKAWADLVKSWNRVIEKAQTLPHYQDTSAMPSLVTESPQIDRSKWKRMSRDVDIAGQ